MVHGTWFFSFCSSAGVVGILEGLPQILMYLACNTYRNVYATSVTCMSHVTLCLGAAGGVVAITFHHKTSSLLFVVFCCVRLMG